MLRTALRPRWLGLFALLLVVVAACVELGLWQLGVARDTGRAEAVAAAAGRPVTEIDAVIAPHSAFPAEASSRRVTATGRYVPGQRLVAGRRLDGRSGYWVLTPLVLDRGADAGATLPVVRGFVSDPVAPRPPAGTVEVEGALAPGESPPGPGEQPVPDGQLASVDLSVLVNVWRGDLYNAFVFAIAERRPGDGAVPADGVRRVPPPRVDSGLAWRNAAYAVQWWVFGAFAVWMWFRMVRDDALRERAAVARESEDGQ